MSSPRAFGARAVFFTLVHDSAALIGSTTPHFRHSLESRPPALASHGATVPRVCRWAASLAFFGGVLGERFPQQK